MSDAKDIDIPAPSMAQSMYVAAASVGALIGTFGDPAKGDDELRTIHTAAVSVFLWYVVKASKHPDTMLCILEALIDELRNPEKKA